MASKLVLACAICSSGWFGGGAFGVVLPCSTAVINLKNARVLAAAPETSNVVLPENLAFVSKYAPPEYLIVALLNSHSSHSIPSIVCPPLMTFNALSRINIGGTDGMPPGNTATTSLAPSALISSMLYGFPSEAVPRDGNCAKVEVWIPKNSTTDTARR